MSCNNNNNVFIVSQATCVESVNTYNTKTIERLQRRQRLPQLKRRELKKRSYLQNLIKELAKRFVLDFGGHNNDLEQVVKQGRSRNNGLNG